MGFNYRFGIYGGVQIKLKLGKDEPTPSKDDSSGTAEKIPEVKEQTKPAGQSEKKPEPERKIIKFDTPEKTAENKKEEAASQDLKKKMTSEIKKPATTKVENISDVTKIVGDKTPGASADAAREELEQRRHILQNMKDFDFQIKKNQEDITGVIEKVESLSKDLDDLVSLYEIVSEQMNPFVGLSKVTKKRIDALENFTKEVDGVKTRISELESMLEKTGVTTGGSITQPPIKSTNEVKTRPETPQTQSVTPVIQSPIPTVIQSTAGENISDTEMDKLLSKSLESLLIEQNIDTMINEFFISLK